MYEQSGGSALDSLDRPDIGYGVLAGLYVGVLSLVPISLLGVGVTSDGATDLRTYVFLPVVIAMPVAVVVTRLRGLPERLGASKLVVGLVVPPVVPAGYLLVADSAAVSPSVSFLVWIPIVVGGVLLGHSLIRRSRRQYIDAVAGDVACEWTAGLPQPFDRFVRYGVGGVLGVNALYWCIQAGWIPGPDWPQPVVVLVALAGILVWPVHDYRRGTYRVTAAGVVRWDFLPTVLKWDTVESYELTADTLRIRRRGWRPDIRCALSDIENAGAVDDALSRHLQRE